MADINNLYSEIRKKYLSRKRIEKRNYPKPNIIEYFFFERKRIATWNKNKNLISFSFLGLKLSLSENTKKNFNDIFLFTVTSAGKYLKAIIENIWKTGVLTIKEYNLIVLFFELYQKMHEIYKSVEFGKNFIIFEEVFLQLVVNEKSTADLLIALEKSFVKYKEEMFKNDLKLIADTLSLISSFFFPKENNISIYDIIIAHNIVEAKRALQWEDLYEPTIDEVVNSNFYDCSFDVFKEIYNQIKNYISKIETIEKDIKSFEWVEKYKPKIEASGLTPKKVIFFYETILKKDWKKDSSDFFLLMITILKGIADKTTELFLSKITMITEEEMTIQEIITVSNDFLELMSKMKEELGIAKERHISITPIKINLFTALKEKKIEENLTDQNQKAILESIYITLSYIPKLAYQLHIFLNNKVESGKTKLIIIKPDEWKGKILYSVILFYIELFIELSLYVGEKNLIKELKKIENFKNEIEKYKKEIEYLYDKDRIIEKFLIDERMAYGKKSK